ncbi:MAG: outer membrane protein assembly factor BamA [Pseudohongiellaceae bacterium]
MKKLFFCLLVTAGFCHTGHAQNFTIADIIVDGYQRVQPGIIYDLLPVGIGDEINAATSAQVIRSLAASEYFDEIEVYREGNVLVITVLERPSVAEIVIEGNSVLETEDIIENMATADIAEGQIFTRAALELIRQGIQDVYSSRGRYGAAVDIEVEELPRNRVAITLDINEGEESRIRHINIVGNEDFEEEDLLEMFELGSKPWWMFMSRRDRYSREQFTGDLERLESFYLDNGYVAFNIDSTPIAITPDREEVYITINITEGGRFTVNEVDLAGDLVDAEANLRARTLVFPGQTYSQALITASEEFMVQFLGNLGYAFAEVSGVPDVDEDNQIVSITFFVEPGKRTYVNRISFSGNVTTADEVLRREMRQLESAPASSLQIEQSKVRLERLGYFESVEVETEEVPGTEDQIDVHFSVVEQSFGAISFQVGTGGGGDFFISASLQAQNFLGTGRTVAVGLNRSRFQKGVSFQYLDPYYTPDGVSRGFSVFFREIDSPFNVSDFNTTTYGGSLSFSYPISEVSGIGFDIGFTHTELSAGLGSVQEIVASPAFYDGIDHYFISAGNTDITAGVLSDAVLGEVADLRPEQLLMNPDLGFVDKYGTEFDNFTVTSNWYRSTLNRGQLPTAGSLHNLGMEITLPGSDLEYARFSYTGQFYWPLSRSQQWVVALRTNLGYGIGYGDTEELPFFNNYFAGGLSAAGVVRGFEENSLGPQSSAGARYLTQSGVRLLRDEDGMIRTTDDGSAVGFDPASFAYRTIPLVDADGDPVLDANGDPEIQLAIENFVLNEDFDSFGGNILTTATLELLFPIPFIEDRSRVRSAFFIDAGNVFSSDCTTLQTMRGTCTNFDTGEIRYSAGISVTYLSPFGPLTFYLAKPFGNEGDDTKTFDFTIGTGF